MNDGDGRLSRPGFPAVESRPMPSDVLSCPYCNSPAAVPPGARPGQRIPCPRCGESFPYRGPTDDRVTPSAAPAPAPPPDAVAPARHLSNRAVALVILVGMAAMAIIGLVYALNTEAIRRSYDVKLPKSRAISIPWYAFALLAMYVLGLVALWFWGWNRREQRGQAPEPVRRRLSVLYGLSVLVFILVELIVVVMHARAPRPAEPEGPPAVRAVPPAELAALGYLPDDTDVILAVHAAELLDEPSGRDLTRHLGNDVLSAASIENWSGLKLDDIDHAVLGLTLDESLLVHPTLVVRARRPIDQEKVRAALKAQARRELDGRPVYPFLMRTGLPLLPELEANAWFADERTLVVAKKFDDGPGHRVPLAPHAGIDHLRPDLRALLRERLGAPAQVWLAGHRPDWDTLSPLVRLVLQRKENAAAAKVTTFGLWLTAGPDGATVRGAFDCEGEDAARALEAYLAPANHKGIKEWVAPGDSGPMERAFANSLKITQHGTWVELQASADAESIRQEK
jgi:hypothetical protein